MKTHAAIPPTLILVTVAPAGLVSPARGRTRESWTDTADVLEEAEDAS